MHDLGFYVLITIRLGCGSVRTEGFLLKGVLLTVFRAATRNLDGLGFQVYN